MAKANKLFEECNPAKNHNQKPKKLIRPYAEKRKIIFKIRMRLRIQAAEMGWPLP